jgi:hypothetical protein
MSKKFKKYFIHQSQILKLNFLKVSKAKKYLYDRYSRFNKRKKYYLMRVC